jgi:hypothetical protein
MEITKNSRKLLKYKLEKVLAVSMNRCNAEWNVEWRHY